MQSQKPSLISMLIAFGSLLIAGLSLFAQNLPWWGTVGIVLYISAVGLAAVVPTLFIIIQRYLNFLRRRSVLIYSAKPVRKFVTLLMQDLEESRGDTVFYVWKSAKSIDSKYSSPDYDHFHTLGIWLSFTSIRLNTRKIGDLENSLKELSRLAFQYNQFCEKAQREIEQLINESESEEYKLKGLKQDWNNARDRHNHTIKTWEDIVKNINHDIKYQLCFEYYKFLKPIL